MRTGYPQKARSEVDMPVTRGWDRTLTSRSKVELIRAINYVDQVINYISGWNNTAEPKI